MTTPDPISPPPTRPLLRGVLHQAAFLVAFCISVPLVLAAHGPRAQLAAGIFAASVDMMLAVSTLYHRISWGPRARLWMRRADHGCIYLLIAGTYTPIGLVDLHGPMQTAVLAVVWSGAIVAAAIKLFWVGAPGWLSAVMGIGLGWAGVAALPQVDRAAGANAVALLAIGGVAYTVGGIIYALRRPDPVPRIFGYHELFHALTIAAISLQYCAIAFFVLHIG